MSDSGFHFCVCHYSICPHSGSHLCRSLRQHYQIRILQKVCDLESDPSGGHISNGKLTKLIIVFYVVKFS